MSLETAGGAAALKFFGAAVIASAMGTALGLILMWPRTLQEAFTRCTCSFGTSFVFGPLLAMGAHSLWPGLFDSARALGQQYAGNELAGLLWVGAPFLALAALFAWWVLGAVVLWLDRRRGKDIGEIAADAAAIIRTVKESV